MNVDQLPLEVLVVLVVLAWLGLAVLLLAERAELGRVHAQRREHGGSHHEAEHDEHDERAEDPADDCDECHGVHARRLPVRHGARR